MSDVPPAVGQTRRLHEGKSEKWTWGQDWVRHPVLSFVLDCEYSVTAWSTLDWPPFLLCLCPCGQSNKKGRHSVTYREGWQVRGLKGQPSSQFRYLLLVSFLLLCLSHSLPLDPESHRSSPRKQALMSRVRSCYIRTRTWPGKLIERLTLEHTQHQHCVLYAVV